VKVGLIYADGVESSRPGQVIPKLSDCGGVRGARCAALGALEFISPRWESGSLRQIALPRRRQRRSRQFAGEKVDQRAEWREENDQNPNELGITLAGFASDAVDDHPNGKAHHQENEQDDNQVGASEIEKTGHECGSWKCHWRDSG